MNNLVTNFLSQGSNGGNSVQPVIEETRRARKRDLGGEERRPIQCFGCGGPHFIRECPARMGQAQGGMMSGMQPQMGQNFFPQQQQQIGQQMGQFSTQMQPQLQLPQVAMSPVMQQQQQQPVAPQPVLPAAVAATSAGDTDARIAALTKELEDLKSRMNGVQGNHVDLQIEVDALREGTESRTEDLRQNLLGIETRLPQAEQAFMLATVCRKKQQKLEKDYSTSHQAQTVTLLKIEAMLQRIQGAQAAAARPTQRLRRGSPGPVRRLETLVDSDGEVVDLSSAVDTDEAQEVAHEILPQREAQRRPRVTPEQARAARRQSTVPTN